jgi:hypothetical protein
MGTILDLKGNRFIWKDTASGCSALLSVLGVLASMKLIPHRLLVESILPPFEDGWDFESRILSIPFRSTINLIVRGKDHINDRYPFSKQDLRSELLDEVYPDILNHMTNSALMKLKTLGHEVEKKVNTYADMMVLKFPLPDLMNAVMVRGEGFVIFSDDFIASSDQDTLILSSIRGLLTDLLWEDGKFDISDAVDRFEGNRQFYYRQLDLKVSENLVDDANRVVYQ